MARTAARTGKGTKLYYAATASATGTNRTAIGELTDVGIPEANIEKAEATHYESDSSTSEFIPIPWKSYSDVPFEVNYLKAQTTTVNGLLGVEKYFQVELPDASIFEFYGFISKWGGATPNKGKISQKGVMTVGGVTTFTAGA